MIVRPRFWDPGIENVDWSLKVSRTVSLTLGKQDMRLEESVVSFNVCMDVAQHNLRGTGDPWG
jgi:hypothetical protein